MKKKNILVYSTQHLNTGGIENHIIEFCINMSPVANIDLIIPFFDASPETENKLKKVCNNLYVGKTKNKVKVICFLLLNRIKLYRKSYNAVYTNGQGNTIWILGKIFKYKKWVHHHHTAGDKEDQVTWPTLYTKSLLKADNVIACSSKNASDIKVFLDRRIDTIPVFSRKIEISKTNEFDNIIKFGYYGRLIPEKGIEIICNLSNDLCDDGISFLIWGEGEKYNKEYFSKFSNLDYRGNFTSKKELQKILTEINAFLLATSHAEGLPVSLLECMGAGVPWLATDRGGISDIAIDNYATRLLKKNSSYLEIKDAVKKLAKDIREERISRKKQIELYEMKFSKKIVVKQWKEILGI